MIALGLADVVNDKDTNCRHEDHGDIKAIPAIASDGLGDDDIVILDDAHDLPEEK